MNEFSQVLIEENSLDDAVNYLTVATTTAQSINDISTQVRNLIRIIRMLMRYIGYRTICAVFDPDLIFVFAFADILQLSIGTIIPKMEKISASTSVPDLRRTADQCFREIRQQQSRE